MFAIVLPSNVLTLTVMCSRSNRQPKGLQKYFTVICSYDRASIRAVDVNESFKQKKTLSTVSSNVSNDNSNNHHSNSSTSRRNPADAALHFRVPTLYPSNDGLHLLTSDKNSRQFSDRRYVVLKSLSFKRRSVF